MSVKIWAVTIHTTHECASALLVLVAHSVFGLSKVVAESEEESSFIAQTQLTALR